MIHHRVSPRDVLGFIICCAEFLLVGKDAINACPANNSICTNTDPSYMCTCAEYYTGDGYTECIDIDECALNGTEALCGTIANGIKVCINYGQLIYMTCNIIYI